MCWHGQSNTNSWTSVVKYCRLSIFRANAIVVIMEPSQTAANPETTAQLVNGMSRDELAVVYCSAILADDDVTITADKLTTLLKAANLTHVEPIWPTLYARALGAGCDVRRLLTSVGAVGSGPAAGQTQQTATTAVVEEESKKEAAPISAPLVDDDSDEDLNLDLFG